MAEKFQSLRLSEAIVSNGDRAYSLTGVSATITATQHYHEPSSSSRLLAKLLVRGHRGAHTAALRIEGPGFSWNIPIEPQKLPAAEAFAEKINDAARRVRV